MTLTNCFCKLAASPRTGLCPNDDNSVSFRMIHSVSSRSDNKSAFQCSEFDSKRFLKMRKCEMIDRVQLKSRSHQENLIQ